MVLIGNLRDDQYIELVQKKVYGGGTKASAVPIKPKAATTSKAKPKATTTSKPKAKAAPKSSSKSSGSSGGGGGGGGGGIKLSSDKPQIAALEKLLATGFAAARDQKIANTKLIYEQQDAELMKGYRGKIGGLNDTEADNEKAEADASFGNVANRARENVELLAQTASLGAGETDTLRAQLMAIRNFDANQSDINRSYFDTQRSVNTAITDLNNETRTARINMATDAIGDYESSWSNYYNQRADAWTQMGNIHANPYSDSHNAKSTAYASMAKDAATVWKNPGVNKSLQDWKGDSFATEEKLNNSQFGASAQVSERKRPEGSTLRKWN